MFKTKIVPITVASLFVMSNAFAAGLAQDVDELQITSETLVGAVDDQSIAINANTNAVNAVAAQIAALPLPAIYDYKDFSANVSSKTFSTTFASGCGDTEVRTLTRTVNGDTTNLKVNRTRSSAGRLCHNKSFNYVLTPEARKLVSRENNDLGGNLLSTDILGKPFTVRKSAMVEGKAFGGATGIKRQSVGGTPVLISVFVNTTTVERVQDVTVPAGTFTDCLKIHTTRNSGVIGRFERYSWHCAGLGEVKRTQVDPVTLEHHFWKLTSYTP